MQHLDTLKIYKDFIEAGASQEISKVIANTLNDLFHRLTEDVFPLGGMFRDKKLDEIRVALESLCSKK